MGIIERSGIDRIGFHFSAILVDQKSFSFCFVLGNPAFVDYDHPLHGLSKLPQCLLPILSEISWKRHGELASFFWDKSFGDVAVKAL